MTIYYKITNKKEYHHNYQYHDGLNILEEQFNDNALESCVGGGFYFTDIEHIFCYLDYGCYVREVGLPTNDPNFMMIADPNGNKWRANRIILGKKYELQNVMTFKLLIDRGADIHVNNDYALQWASTNGCLDIVKFLVEKNADIHTDNDCALRAASIGGHLNIIKYLVEIGADIHVLDECALRFASLGGHLSVVQYLVEMGADIHADNDCALKWASENDRTYVTKFLIECGAKSHNCVSE